MVLGYLREARLPAQKWSFVTQYDGWPARAKRVK